MWFLVICLLMLDVFLIVMCVYLASEWLRALRMLRKANDIVDGILRGSEE